MAHKQTDIRNALASLLSGATDAQTRVYKNKTHLTPSEKLPVLIVHDGQESAVPRDARATSYMRTWTVTVEIKVDGTTEVDTGLDTIAKQVEDLILANRTLGGLSTDIRYKGSDPSFDGGGAKTIGTKILNYEIQYIY